MRGQTGVIHQACLTGPRQRHQVARKAGSAVEVTDVGSRAGARHGDEARSVKQGLPPGGWEMDHPAGPNGALGDAGRPLVIICGGSRTVHQIGNRS